MRVRRHAIAVAFAASLSLGAASAHAQGGVVTPTRADAVEAAAPLGPRAPDAVVTPPTVLDETWARALKAVVDGVKHLLDGEPIEAREALAPKVSPPPESAPKRSELRAPFVPAFRAAWLPVTALRETLAASPIQPSPMEIGPATESPVDTRGQHAVLLGARMQLPWAVP
jgi:hypothetical protein